MTQTVSFLLDRTVKVTEIKRKTSAKLFEDVEVGDVLRFSVTLQKTGGYQSDVTVENMTKGHSRYDRMSVIAKSLDVFRFEEV